MVIPVPGEFFVVSSDALPSLNRKLINQAIRENTNATGSPNSRFAATGKSGAQYKPPLTDRKKKERAERNRSSNFTQPMGPMSQSNNKQPNLAYPQDGVTMSSLQGEISKQMSLPTFKQLNQLRDNR